MTSDAGPGKYERHAQGGVVDKDAVRDLAVLAEGLSMVRGHDEGRRVRIRTDRLDHARDLPIALGNLFVVADADGTLIAGAAVWGMRLEQVNPEEEPRRLTRGGAPMPGKPGDRLAHGLMSGSFVCRFAVQARQPIAVGLKAAVEPESPVQWKCGHEPRRGESLARQGLGQERGGRVRAKAVVARAVAGGIPAAQQRRVRRQRDRRRGVGAIEPGAPRREAIDRRRSRRGIAVRPDAIGTQRIDRDEDDIARDGRRLARWRRRRTAAREGECDQQQGCAGAPINRQFRRVRD